MNDIIKMARSAIRLVAKDTDLTNFDQEATILDRYQFLYWFAKEVAAAEQDRCCKIVCGMAGSDNVVHTTTVEERLERFAALVRADERERIIAQNAPEIEKINAHIKTLEEAVAAEREACAKVCEENGTEPDDHKSYEGYGEGYQDGSNNCAAAIRSRT